MPKCYTFEDMLLEGTESLSPGALSNFIQNKINLINNNYCYLLGGFLSKSARILRPQSFTNILSTSSLEEQKRAARFKGAPSKSRQNNAELVYGH
jgi:hypothetical protein